MLTCFLCAPAYEKGHSSVFADRKCPELLFCINMDMKLSGDIRFTGLF